MSGPSDVNDHGRESDVCWPRSLSCVLPLLLLTCCVVSCFSEDGGGGDILPVVPVSFPTTVGICSAVVFTVFGGCSNVTVIL